VPAQLAVSVVTRLPSIVSLTGWPGRNPPSVTVDVPPGTMFGEESLMLCSSWLSSNAA